MAYNKLRILITGAGGFVGTHLTTAIKERLQNDSELYICSLSPDLSISYGEHFVLDITQRGDVFDAIKRIKPTHIVHLAAISAVPFASEHFSTTWDVNFFGTINLVEAVCKYAPKCRFIFASSSEIYGGSFVGGGVLDESTQVYPLNEYATIKAAADLYLGQKAYHGANIIRVRPFNHTGPGQTESFVVPAFAAQLARISVGLQDPVIHVGNLNSHRDFLDVRDVIQAYLGCVFTEDLPSDLILNIASGQSRSIQDILSSLIELSGIEVDVKVDSSRYRSIDMVSAVGDATKARELINWTATIPWEKTLQDTLEYWFNSYGAKLSGV